MNKLTTQRNGSIHSFSLLFFWRGVFLGPHLHHMEVPRPEAESELQLPAYTTATAMWDPSHIFDLQHSSRQRQILNPLSRARDGTHNLMVPGRIHFCYALTRTPRCIGFLTFSGRKTFQVKEPEGMETESNICKGKKR